MWSHITAKLKFTFLMGWVLYLYMSTKCNYTYNGYKLPYQIYCHILGIKVVMCHMPLSYVICHMSYVICHMSLSYVICHMSYVICHMPYVTRHVSHVKPKNIYKVVELVGGGSVINGAYPIQLADPGEASGCSTNSFVINSVR